MADVTLKRMPPPSSHSGTKHLNLSGVNWVKADIMVMKAEPPEVRPASPNTLKTLKLIKS